MPFGEIILTAIADAVFGYLLDKHGDRLGDWARDKRGRDPIKKALKNALKETITQFEQRHPQWIADYFDASFFEHEASPILAQFLIRDGHPDPSELAACWADSLNIHRPERRSYYTRELEPVASDFLTLLAHHLKAQKALRELQDSSAFEQLADNVRAIRQKLGADRATLGTRRDYLRWMIACNLYIDTRGTFQVQRQVQVKLDEVYVSLYAKDEISRDSVDLILYGASEKVYVGELKSGTDTDESIIDWTENGRDLDSSKSARYSVKPTAYFYQHPGRSGRAGNRAEYLLSPEDHSTLDWFGEILDLNAVINRHDRLIILGDPGSGKTTLLHFLALKHAQALYDGLREASPELGTARFPILIRISEYIENGAWKEHPLSEFLAKSCVLHECPADGLEDLLRLELEKGNCLVLLDGLDEVVSTDERRGVVRRIEDFVRRYAEKANRFVITSRIAGYSSAPLGEPFARYTILEMRETQIQRFLERWCQAVEDAQTPDLPPEQRKRVAQREIAGIMRAMQDSPGVRRLAANPLLLRTVALIHRTGAQLPHKRIELYKLAADTLAHTWRTAQGVPESALVEESYLTRLLSKLAYWLHVNKSTGIATEQDIYRELGQEWARLKGLSWDEDNLEIEGEVEKFLQKVREHTGLVVERAPKQYGFMHLTFEEYFASRYLVARSKDRATLIHQHLHDPRWEEPILLALGFVGLDSPEDAAEQLEIAILARNKEAEELGFGPSQYEELLGRDYLFALRCLGDSIPVRPKLLTQMIHRLAIELLHHTGSAQFQRYRQAQEEKLEYLKGTQGGFELASHLIAVLKEAPPVVANRAASYLGKLGQSTPEVVAVLLNTLHRPANSNIRYQAADSLALLGQTDLRAKKALLASLQDGDLEVRVAVTRSLGIVARVSPDLSTTLINALQDTRSRVRAAAAHSLGELSHASSDVVAALIASLKDDRSSVRAASVSSLSNLDQSTPDVIEALVGALHDSDYHVRFRAAAGLRKLGHTTPKVLRGLLEALRRLTEIKYTEGD